MSNIFIKAYKDTVIRSSLVILYVFLCFSLRILQYLIDKSFPANFKNYGEREMDGLEADFKGTGTRDHIFQKRGAGGRAVHCVQGWWISINTLKLCIFKAVPNARPLSQQMRKTCGKGCFHCLAVQKRRQECTFCNHVYVLYNVPAQSGNKKRFQGRFSKSVEGPGSIWAAAVVWPATTLTTSF